MERVTVLGTHVRIVGTSDGEWISLRFRMPRYAWTVTVLAESAEPNVQASLTLVRAMLSQLLCPSECGEPPADE